MHYQESAVNLTKGEMIEVDPIEDPGKPKERMNAKENLSV